MTGKPSALRLAECIISARDLMWHRDAAAELRRLHDENEELRAAIKGLQGGNESLARISAAGREKYVELMAEKAELTEALREMLDLWAEDPAYGHDTAYKAQAVLKKVEGKV